MEAKLGIVGKIPEPAGSGAVVVATGGTSDIPVAEEAAVTAEVHGSRVVRLYDVGVSGLHRLLAHADELMAARAVVAVAGMEGALASVVGGLVDCSGHRRADERWLRRELRRRGRAARDAQFLRKRRQRREHRQRLRRGLSRQHDRPDGRTAMNILYLDCAMGAAGDMLMAALLELLPDKDTFLRDMNALGLPGIEVTAEPSVKCGVTGDARPCFLSMARKKATSTMTTSSMNMGTNITTPVCMRSSAGSGSCPCRRPCAKMRGAVYRSIADAESRVHGAPVDQIHFHEVGTLDALADVVGVCWLMHRLAPDAVYASPVHVGSGR